MSHNNKTLFTSTANAIVNASNQVEHMEVEEELDSRNQFTSIKRSAFENSSKLNESFLKPISTSQSTLALMNTTFVNLEKSAKLNNDVIKPIFTEQNSTEEDNIEKTDKSNKKPTSYQRMKEKMRPLVKMSSLNCQNATSSKTKCCSCSIFFKVFFLLLPLLFIIFATILYHNDDHKHSSDYVNAIAELKKEIYGQDEAIETLIEYLELDTPSLKVLALVGGTGVGKTYTVQIIKENFPREYTVHQYYPPIKNVKSINFSFLYPDLIILENLKERDLKDVVDFLKRRSDVSSDRYVTVIAVFNIEQIDVDFTRSIDWNHSLNVIENSFADGNIDVKIIPYASLSEDALEKCIMKALLHGYGERMLSDEQINLVKQYLLTNNAGCKGAYSKIQLAINKQFAW
ncbi:uncharacterized protein [Linepithema humile]